MLEKVPTEIVEWLHANMDVAASGCWVWNKYVGEQDRPLGRRMGRNVSVRRAVVESFDGLDAQPNWIARRKCTTRGCVHPDHLYAGPIGAESDEERIAGLRASRKAYYAKNRERVREASRVRSRDPEVRAAKNKQRAAWRAANPDAYREQRKRDAASETTIATRRRWYEANSSKHRQTVKKWLAIEENRLRVLEHQRKWKAANKEKVSAVLKSWRARNPEAVGDLKAKRRAAQMQRMPAWLDKFQRAAIRAIYAESRKLSESTGVRHTVDHMCPLQGDSVSGLHVPWNLRVVTRADNAKKHNNLVEALCMPAFI